MKQLTLVTALGNENLALQLVDFFNGGSQYRYNPEASAIRSLFVGMTLVELHLVCTEGVLDGLERLKPLLARDYPQLRLCPIRLPCQDIACANDDEAMRQLVYGAVRDLAAKDLVIASGGRKTLTNRLIEAGLLYGCRGYLSITAPNDRDPAIRKRTEEFNVLWASARQFSEERRNLIIKDTLDDKNELGDNFRSLYLLPLSMIDRLREARLGTDPAKEAEDLAWLQRLPKADLHCHLGGAYDAALLKDMGKNLLDELNVDPARREKIRRHIEQQAGVSLSALTAEALRQLDSGGQHKSTHCLSRLSALFAGLDEPKHVYIAALVAGCTVQQIEALSHDGKPAGQGEKDLAWYMACGDLGGSSLLQTEGNLRAALGWLLEQSRLENVDLLEVRFSPDNYTRAGLNVRRVIDILLDEARRLTGQKEFAAMTVNFLIMATRHKDRAAMIAHVAAAVTFAESGNNKGPRVTGFDLAGQEEGNDPALFQEVFMPLHHHFINITIHAGEMADDDKIWQALYLLHAKRIGHGLKLTNNERMMRYVRDYGIAIEMCPSSNRQTNNFRRFDQAETGAAYPLANYLKRGIAVTLNTDNRGISATTLSHEYLMAARLTDGGLSRWEILRLVKNGFKAAFLPKDEKDNLLKEVDQQVFNLVLDDFFPEGR